VTGVRDPDLGMVFGISGTSGTSSTLDVGRRSAEYDLGKADGLLGLEPTKEFDLERMALKGRRAFFAVEVFTRC